MKFDKISEACSDLGAEPYLNSLVGYWMKVRKIPLDCLFTEILYVSCFFQDHSLGEVTSVFEPSMQALSFCGPHVEVATPNE